MRYFMYFSFCLWTCVFPYSTFLGNQEKIFNFETEEGELLERIRVVFIPTECSGARSMTPCGVLTITTIQEADCARCPLRPSGPPQVSDIV